MSSCICSNYVHHNESIQRLIDLTRYALVRKNSSLLHKNKIFTKSFKKILSFYGFRQRNIIRDRLCNYFDG